MKKYTFRVSILFIIILILLFLLCSAIFSIIERSDSTYVIMIFFGSLGLLFYLSLVLVYLLLRKRNNDIELSRNMYYYSKPFMIKLSKDGTILSFNQNCEINIKDCGRYKTIFDFECSKENYDILEVIHRQKAFNITYESNQGTIEYIRFLPLKSKVGYFLIGENVTSHQKDFEFHRNMALYNNITRLPNKNFLGIKLQELFDDKTKLKKKNSLVAIDIVQFKNINKLFGKRIGDETLVELGKIASSTLEGSGGLLFNTDIDDFMILFSDLEKYQDVVDWVNYLLQLLQKPINVQGNLFTIEIKVGIFHIETDKYPNLNPVSTYDNVILALKKAKGSRRSSTVVYDIGLGQLFTRDQAMELDLVNAIKNQELMMYLQPQFNDKINRVVGFEALIRWNNPKYLLESPAHFIELAEQNNLIVDIGRIVINETFKIAKEIEQYDVKISINISPIQILQTGFVNDIIGAFDKYKLRKNSICLEITETFLMESYESVIDKLTLLKNHGFSIHLDNFGSGYSSMLYLKDLPIDGISINKEFIRYVSNDKYSRAIVSKIISLAQSLELDVIAEGVEDIKQKEFLTDNGCHVMQGFLISKALPKEEAVKFMLSYNNKNNQN